MTAGQVVSNVSPSGASLSYSAVASQCENFGVGTRKKMSSVLRLDTESSSLLLTFPETPAQTPMKEQLQSQAQYKNVSLGSMHTCLFPTFCLERARRVE